ncbi:MAG: TlpA family protein disulfide reductase [Prevotella sp.]|nr:TlpA family protein disulfide reductase [Prevotella sp.]
MKKIFLTLTLLTVTMSLVASCANRPKGAEPSAAEAAEVQQAEAADMAPDFELPDLQGNPLKLSSLRGKYVVLDFWGSWCIWCIRGIPHMKEAYAKYKDKMEILGVDCRDTEAKWKAAVEEHALPWLQVRCPDEQLQSIASKYNIEGFPTKAVIDPEGRLVKVIVGEDPAFYTFLDELFAE